MTGWGEARLEREIANVRVEMKSVNNKFLDCTIKMPRAYMFAEETFKSAVSKRVSRGKVDVYVTVDLSNADSTKLTVNMPLAKAYRDAAERVAWELGVDNPLTAQELLRFPDVIAVERDETDSEAIAELIAEALNAALNVFEEQREREGARLGADIAGKLDIIERHIETIRTKSPQTVSDYRARLETRMAEVLRDTVLDEARILAEAAIFADRVAVDEETVRLTSHLTEARRMLKSREPVGRRLDFLVQEMNREANTIGSKCQDAQLARVVVELKAEIEKIREQAQNLE
jgi:uncharacterized protein (TIGR00255 family)